MLRIESNGTITVMHENIRAFLKRHAGMWRIMSTIPRLLVLQKMEAVGKGTPRALLSGSLERPGWLIEIINFVSNSRLSGDLVTVSGKTQRELIFEKGALRVAFSTARRDLLGEFILSEGILTKVQLENALRAQTTDKRLGQVLVEQGLLTGPDVYAILQRKTERIFYDAIGLGEGVYYFITDFDLARLPASMYMDTQALLMEGVKRIDDLEFYNQTVPRRTPRLAASPGLLDGYSEIERRFIECMDGKRSLADIDAQVHVGVDECIGMVHRFVVKGLIQTISAREMEVQALHSVVSSFNRALETVYGAIEGHMNAEDLNRLGREFIQNGSHNNRTLQKVNPGQDGRLALENIRAIYEDAKERDRVKLIVMVLTQYISFILFNAIEHLPPEKQTPLSAEVNETLGEIFASNL